MVKDNRVDESLAQGDGDAMTSGEGVASNSEDVLRAMAGITRRDALRFGGLAALGATAFGAMVGCAPSTPGDGDDAGTGAGDAGTAGGTTGGNRWETPAGVDWRTPPTPVNDAQITDGGIYDVVVVGGGQAGTWAARGASKNGMKVCVLEATPEENFMYVGGEVAVINSEWALARGADRIDHVEYMNMWLQRNANRTNQTLVRNFLEQSGRIMDWSISEIEAVEPDFYSNTDRVNIYSADADSGMVMNPSGYQFYRSTIIHRPVTGGGGDWEWGKVVMTHHRNKAIEEGATWNFGTYAEYLEKDGSGRVVAVVARLADDSYARFTGTRAVVLAAGDFASNVDMVRDINDEYRHLAEAYGDIELAQAFGMMSVRDGMGIKLGVWAGGHVEVGPRTGMNTGQSGPWESAPWGPGFMLLNQRGERFCNECAGGTEGSGYLSSRQPRGAVVSFADANYLDTVLKMPPAHGAINITSKVTFHGIDPLKESMAALDPGAMEPTEAGVYCANSFEELLDKLGVYNDGQRAKALAARDQWNKAAVSGADEAFGFDPRVMTPLAKAPFYAIKGNAEDIYVGLCQTTGLDTDGNGCVLNSDLFPIPGLYAAGNDSGNRYIVNYGTPISGISLGYCMTEGYLLGERLATASAAELEV